MNHCRFCFPLISAYAFCKSGTVFQIFLSRLNTKLLVRTVERLLFLQTQIAHYVQGQNMTLHIFPIDLHIIEPW